MNFGTQVGRLLTLWVTLPFGLAFLAIEAGNLISNLLFRMFTPSFPAVDMPLPQLVTSAVGMMAEPDAGAFVAAEEAAWLSYLNGAAVAAMRRKLGTLEFGSPAYIILFLVCGLFFAGLFHSAGLRHKVWHYAGTALQWLRYQLVYRPIALLSSTKLKGILRSWPVQLLYWYAFKPLLLFLLLYSLIYLVLWIRQRLVNPFQPVQPQLPLWGWAIVFLVSNFLVNSRPGQATTKALWYSTLQLLDQMRAGLLPRLFNFVVALFKNSVHFVESMLFHVDESLRLRQGESQLSMNVRAALTVIWFPISYLIRFNLIMFIEPLLNPVKLPVCSIAFKFWLPAYFYFQSEIQGYPFIVWAVLSWINFWIADAFGFISWEVKENWRLYRSNRSPTLGPVNIGPYGETLAGLLQPGFHSGTLPKLYTRSARSRARSPSDGTLERRTCVPGGAHARGRGSPVVPGVQFRRPARTGSSLAKTRRTGPIGPRRHRSPCPGKESESRQCAPGHEPDLDRADPFTLRRDAGAA